MELDVKKVFKPETSKRVKSPVQANKMGIVS